MSCADCRDSLIDYVHHQLDAREDAEMFEHVQSCAHCRAEYDAELEIREAVRAAFGAEREMPTSVLAGVRQAMRAEPAPSALDRLRAVLRPAVIAPAAAAIVVAAVIGFGQTHRQAPAISSEYFVRQHVASTIGSPGSDPAWSAYLLTSANAESSSDAAPPSGN